MQKSAAAALLILCGTAAFAGVMVIVPYEEESSGEPVKQKPLTEEQKKHEALFRERIKARDAKRQEAEKARQEFQTQQRKERESPERQGEMPRQ